MERQANGVGNCRSVCAHLDDAQKDNTGISTLMLMQM